MAAILRADSCSYSLSSPLGAALTVAIFKIAPLGAFAWLWQQGDWLLGLR